MQINKLLKNWIFTLIITVILVTFGVLLIFFWDELLRILLGCALIVYLILVLFDNALHYRGKIQIFAVLELLVVASLAICLLANRMGFFSALKIEGLNATVGFVMYLRALVELFHSYFIRGSAHKEEAALWKFSVCIAFLTLGVILIFAQIINVKVFQVFMIICSFVSAAVLGYVTYTNRRESQKARPKKEKNEKKAEENGRENPEKNEDKEKEDTAAEKTE